MDSPKSVIRNINISTLTILKILAVVVIAALLYAIRDIIGIVFVAIVFAAAISPLVDWFQKFKVPRWLTVLFIYVIFFSLLIAIILLLVPPITTEIQAISKDFPGYYERAIRSFESLRQYSQEHGLMDNFQRLFSSAESQLAKVPGSIFGTITNVFGGVIALIAILVIIFYITVEESGIKRFFQSIAPTKYQPYLVQLTNRIQHKLGLWLRGQLILCLIIGVMTYIGLLILGVKYALVLALIAGVLEFVPYIGPILSAVPAVVLTAATTQSILKTIFVVVLFIIIQELENNLIVPKVMQRSVGLNPVIVIIVMLIGGKLAGVAGVILAVPVATIIAIILRDIFETRDEKELQLEEEKKVK